MHGVRCSYRFRMLECAGSDTGDRLLCPIHHTIPVILDKFTATHHLEPSGFTSRHIRNPLYNIPVLSKWTWTIRFVKQLHALSGTSASLKTERNKIIHK